MPPAPLVPPMAQFEFIFACSVPARRVIDPDPLGRLVSCSVPPPVCRRLAFIARGPANVTIPAPLRFSVLLAFTLTPAEMVKGAVLPRLSVLAPENVIAPAPRFEAVVA